MTGVVVDASVVVAVLAPEIDTDIARSVMGQAQTAGAVAPAHLAFEIGNALTMKHRRGFFDRDYRDAALKSFIALEIDVDAEPDRGSVIERIAALADRHGLTVYDAAYLELAVRRACRLATLNSTLRQAAKREGLATLPE